LSIEIENSLVIIDTTSFFDLFSMEQKYSGIALDLIFNIS